MDRIATKQFIQERKRELLPIDIARVSVEPYSVQILLIFSLKNICVNKLLFKGAPAIIADFNVVKLELDFFKIA